MIAPVDQKPTRYWAIAQVASGGAIVGYTLFDLVNRDSRRGHQLHIPSGGLQVGVSTSGGSPSYTFFETTKPVNFAGFNGVGARITSANLGVIYGYSIVYLTLWVGSAYTTDLLAYIKMTSGSFMLPGGSVSHGVTKLTFGSGNPLGKVPREVPSEDFGTDRVFVKYRIIPKQSRVFVPEDVLFAFDKHNISHQAENSLLVIADLLNNRSKLPVTIEGHTDSIGDPAYNHTLSQQRALAVKTWCVNHQVYKAADFITIGYGHRKPVAPNKRPNGQDNPEGRQKNRRVEILFDGAVPKL